MPLRSLALAVLFLTVSAAPASGDPAVAFGPPVHGPVRLGPTYAADAYHSWPAVDFRIPYGTAVLAVARGTIVAEGGRSAETVGEPGIYLLLELDRPVGDCAVVAYKHLSGFDAEVGDRVREGQTIAASGSSGTLRPHLHMDCFTSVDGFQDPEARADWTMRWCNRRLVPKEASPLMLRRDQLVALHPRAPCRRTSP